MNQSFLEDLTLSLVLKACCFAAEKHKEQLRKDKKTPYINHPLQVTELLYRVGGIRSPEILVASLLHDTLEDTLTTTNEIQQAFGEEVLSMVLEITDDKSLPKSERKRRQIEQAPFLSDGAKQIRIADKSCNVSDVVQGPPSHWDLERKLDYLEWATQVVEGTKGVNSALEHHFYQVLQTAKKSYS